MYKWNKNRKLAYWGIGNIGQRYLENNCDVKPDIIIDSFSELSEYRGIPVIKHTDISEWQKLFIVITVEKRDDIIDYLNKNGLSNGYDYIGYESFFGVGVTECVDTLKYAKEVIDSNPNLKNRIVLQIPFYYSDRMSHARLFFQNYIEKHGIQNFIILHSVQYNNDPQLEMDFQCEKLPFRIPGNSDMESKDWKKKLLSISAEERLEILDIENRKATSVSYDLVAKRYLYYKELFRLLSPKGIVWWGGWARDTYLIKYISKTYGFGFAVAEHGWIKGTINIDHEGIAGQSELCKNPLPTETYRGDFARKKILCVIDYLKETIINDHITTIDELPETINRSSPIFLLVGMGDFGMDMNPNSAYWETNISNCCKGSLDAVRICAEICSRNNWQLIYKPHPKESSTQLIENPNIEGIIYIDNIPIEKLICISDVVISITSAVDYSVCLFDKPLVQIGKNSLNQSGCTYDACETKGLETQMKNALRYGVTQMMKDSYINHLQILLNTVLWDDMTGRELRYGVAVENRIF